MCHSGVPAEKEEDEFEASPVVPAEEPDNPRISTAPPVENAHRPNKMSDDRTEEKRQRMQANNFGDDGAIQKPVEKPRTESDYEQHRLPSEPAAEADIAKLDAASPRVRCAVLRERRMRMQDQRDELAQRHVAPLAQDSQLSNQKPIQTRQDLSCRDGRKQLDPSKLVVGITENVKATRRSVDAAQPLPSASAHNVNGSARITDHEELQIHVTELENHISDMHMVYRKQCAEVSQLRKLAGKERQTYKNRRATLMFGTLWVLILAACALVMIAHPGYRPGNDAAAGNSSANQTKLDGPSGMWRPFHGLSAPANPPAHPAQNLFRIVKENGTQWVILEFFYGDYAAEMITVETTESEFRLCFGRTALNTRDNHSASVIYCHHLNPPEGMNSEKLTLDKQKGVGTVKAPYSPLDAKKSCKAVKDLFVEFAFLGLLCGGIAILTGLFNLCVM